MWTLELLPYLEPLLARSQQPDNLCGPYWIALLLQTFGKQTVSAVEVAIAAHTLLPDHEGCWTPHGAKSLTGEGYDKVPTVPDAAQCGTSLMGLLQATQQLSQGEFCLLPLQTQHWEYGIAELWWLCQTHPEWQIVPLLNSHTSYFWGSHLTPANLSGYLNAGESDPPPADWSVGHFALLGGWMSGRAARLYAILDTYPQLGWQGLHLQPGRAIAQSLERPQHPTDGGVALFVSAKLQDPIEQAVNSIGFEVSTWDNGTPAPQGAF